MSSESLSFFISSKPIDHVAILYKKGNLLDKILSREKTIESRWYNSKYPPWNRIKTDDVIYLKDSGGLVRGKVTVERVLQYNLTQEKSEELFHQYGKKICLNEPDISKWLAWTKSKKYCILLFLKDPQTIKPFQTDKTGFGNACAWMIVGDINKVRKINKDKN